MPYHIGFTGTRHGMTDAQRKTLSILLPCCTHLHHGDCLGSDAQAHVMAVALKLTTVIHPPRISVHRAFCAGDIVYPTDEYLRRNRHIVFCSDVLIGTPEQETEVARSGTWMTLRFAVSTRKPAFIIIPNGRILSAMLTLRRTQ